MVKFKVQMRVSELIEMLEKARAKYGDLGICIEDDDSLGYFDWRDVSEPEVLEGIGDMIDEKVIVI